MHRKQWRFVFTSGSSKGKGESEHDGFDAAPRSLDFSLYCQMGAPKSRELYSRQCCDRLVLHKAATPFQASVEADRFQDAGLFVPWAQESSFPLVLFIPDREGRRNTCSDKQRSGIDGAPGRRPRPAAALGSLCVPVLPRQVRSLPPLLVPSGTLRRASRRACNSTQVGGKSLEPEGARLPGVT